MNSDWPHVRREVHLLGGVFAVNSPENKDQVFIFPNSFANKTPLITLKSFGQLYIGLEKFGLKAIGTEFLYHTIHFDGSALPEFRFNSSYKDTNWLHDYARQAWGEISFSSYKIQHGHLFDLSKRTVSDK